MEITFSLDINVHKRRCHCSARSPPAKLNRLETQPVVDRTSPALQQSSWDALNKSIRELIDQANASNIESTVASLLDETNVVRGKGLLCRSLIEAQASSSSSLTPVHAALVAVINAKLPDIGKLLLTRLVIVFRRGFRRNEKLVIDRSSLFIAHLVNQQVVHELLALEILTILLEKATEDSMEIAVGFLLECGQKLSQVTPRGLKAVMDRLGHVSQQVELSDHVKCLIEVVSGAREGGFEEYPSLTSPFDVVEEDDQITHLISLEEQELDGQDSLDQFQYDPDYESNEEKYLAFKRSIFGDETDDSETSTDDSLVEESDQEDEQSDVADEATCPSIIAAHQQLENKTRITPGREMKLCRLIFDHCIAKDSYQSYFGLLAERFCHKYHLYRTLFGKVFCDIYNVAHMLETNQLEIAGKFFAYLLFKDAVSWRRVFYRIRLTEEEATKSTRLLTKYLFQELAKQMGLYELTRRLKNPAMNAFLAGVFPDDPVQRKSSKAFFASIGLETLMSDVTEL